MWCEGKFSFSLSRAWPSSVPACLTFYCYPIVMEYARDRELFDQVVKESEEKTSMLRIYQICESYIDGELFDQVVKESEKAIIMSEGNVRNFHL